jgi:hypothetical protein
VEKGDNRGTDRHGIVAGWLVYLTQSCNNLLGSDRRFATTVRMLQSGDSHAVDVRMLAALGRFA